MDIEKHEQIKIALLGVIAVMLIIKTVMMQSTGVEKVARPDRDGTIQSYPNNMGGITIPGTNPTAQAVQQINPQPVAAQAREATTMSFDQTDVNLGSISREDNKSHTYKVTNTGLIPLTFDNISTDPGLSLISQPTAPIAPGEIGEIVVQLTAEAGTGAINKTIHVGSNTEPSHMHLTVSADVK